MGATAGEENHRDIRDIKCREKAEDIKGYESLERNQRDIESFLIGILNVEKNQGISYPFHRDIICGEIRIVKRERYMQ